MQNKTRQSVGAIGTVPPQGTLGLGGILPKWGGNTLVFGLTGGTGAGKSHVAAVLEHLGGIILNLDRIGHAVLAGAAYEQVVSTFGKGILATDSTSTLDAPRPIERKKLGQLVFNDPAALAKLNAIVHPHLTTAVYGQLATHLRQHASTSRPLWLVLEGALLHELKLHPVCDTVILVQASEATRLARIMHRDGITQSQAQARLSSQAHLACNTPTTPVDIVIQNDE